MIIEGSMNYVYLSKHYIYAVLVYKLCNCIGYSCILIMHRFASLFIFALHIRCGGGKNVDKMCKYSHGTYCRVKTVCKYTNVKMVLDFENVDGLCSEKGNADLQT